MAITSTTMTVIKTAQSKKSIRIVQKAILSSPIIAITCATARAASLKVVKSYRNRVKNTTTSSKTTTTATITSTPATVMKALSTLKNLNIIVCKNALLFSTTTTTTTKAQNE
jgi:hypothetical protein